MQTSINSFESTKEYKHPKNSEIVEELKSFKIKSNNINGIIGRIEYTRSKNNFFSDEFKRSFEKKLNYYRECLQILKDNQLPLHTAGFRDQFVIRLLGPFFLFQRRQKILEHSRKEPLPGIDIELEDILDLMEEFDVPISFVKDLYRLNDSYFILKD